MSDRRLLIRVGYWRSRDGSSDGIAALAVRAIDAAMKRGPEPTGFAGKLGRMLVDHGKQEFAARVAALGPDASLPWPGDFVDERWDPNARACTLAYLKGGRQHNAFLGFASCRLCAKADNGSRDLTDGTFIWPEGYAHYVEAHGVRPPEEFVAHALRATSVASSYPG